MKKIFVGGIDLGVTQEELKEFFEQYGGVKDCIIMKNMNTNQSRGFGFVTFEEDNIVDQLVKENNFVIHGKKVDVKKA